MIRNVRNTTLLEMYKLATSLELYLKVLHFQLLWTICKLWTNSVLFRKQSLADIILKIS